MQIVIDIPEDTYIATCNKSMLPPDVKNVVNAIKNGIVLPKGRGRLIDEDEVIECIKEVEGEDAIWAIGLIEWACEKRTILEVDKESEE